MPPSFTSHAGGSRVVGKSAGEYDESQRRDPGARRRPPPAWRGTEHGVPGDPAPAMLRVGEVNDRSHCSKYSNRPPLALTGNFAESGIVTTPATTPTGTVALAVLRRPACLTPPLSPSSGREVPCSQQ